MKRAHIRNESDPEDGSNEDTASGDEEDLNDLTAPGPSKRQVGKIKSSKIQECLQRVKLHLKNVFTT